YGLSRLAASCLSLFRRTGSILMAISRRCGLPDFGLPTRRALFSSSSVDSGMSEKSIALSGIDLPLFAACRPRADDADAFFAISGPPYCVNYQKNIFFARQPEALVTDFVVRMRDIPPVQSLRVGEYRCRLLEGHAVLFKLLIAFRGSHENTLVYIR